MDKIAGEEKIIFATKKNMVRVFRELKGITVPDK